MALNKTKLTATVEELVCLLASGRFHELEVLTDSNRMRAEEVKEAVDSYPGKIIPVVSEDDLDVIRIDTPKEERWSVIVRLHTDREGPSDLTMSLTLVSSDAHLYDAEIDDIHVL